MFKLSTHRAKTRMHEKYVHDLVFADDVAITTHTQEDLQRLLDCFSEACRHFGLTISLAKTQVMGQDIKEIPSLFIDNYKLQVIHEFVNLGSTITDNLSIDSELNKRIGKAAMTLSRLTTWSNNMLSDYTKAIVYKACVISTLLLALSLESLNRFPSDLVRRSMSSVDFSKACFRRVAKRLQTV